MSAAGQGPRRPALPPGFALAAAGAIVAASIGLGLHNERGHRLAEAANAETQALILASSVSAALAFGDRDAAQQYLDGLRANPSMVAAAAYGADGLPLATVGRGREAPPERAPAAAAPHVGEGMVVVVVPVAEGGTRLGTVYLRARAEPLRARLGRYAGVGLLALMAALVLAVVGTAQAALARANAELGRKASDLEGANRALQEANARLKEQMAQRERAEEALRQAQRMEAVGQLTGGVAHDFNNLLQAISGCLQLLRRRAGGPEARSLIDAGEQAVDRGAKLTQQLLSFARRQALRPEPVDLRDRLLGMADLLARALRADIRLELDLQPGLWAAEVDPTQLELAVLNLVVNARDAMPDGGMVTIEGRNVPGAPGRVAVTVRDDGPGMPPEVAGRAFEPFFTTKGVGKGSGLGLSQVYGFARQSGGDVRLDTGPGRGTAVSMLLPKSEKAIPTPTVPEAPAVEQGGGDVLLVEDDPVVAAILRATLEDMGHAVTHASTADEALRLVGGGTAPGILLTDVVMPGTLNGVELARLAKSKLPDLAVVVMTGYSDQVGGGEFPVLSKPYGREALSRALANARG